LTDNLWMGLTMKFRNLLLSVAMAAAVSVGAGSAALAGPAWEFTSAGNDFTDGTWDFASAFTVGTAVAASGLGYYASPTNGQVNSNPVALYQCSDAACDGTATLLASTIVTNTFALNGHFRYVTINPITLEPGVGYEVAGVSNGDNYTWNDAGFATDPNVTLTSLSGGTTRWESLGTPDFLNFTNTGEIENDGFWGPNVFLGAATGFTGAPEPSTWALMFVGLAGLGAALRVSRSKRSVALAAA
jgi:hypothetical protein